MELRGPDLLVEIERLQQERDLYRQLLDLGTKDELRPFLEDALALIVKIAGATRGYLEIQDGGADGAPGFWIARDCSEEHLAEIRASISRGIIAAALATGTTIATVSALSDPRFKDLGSVQRNGIEAVLCAPIGAPPVGVLYLQDREEPGPFSEDDRVRAELFARHIAAFVDRLLLRQARRVEMDATREIRKRVRADGVIGRSAQLAKVLEEVAVVAPSNIGVLITGPAGTGKTHIARLIHQNGPRASQPFVWVNVAAVSENLLEAELFGTEIGAYTNAVRRDGLITTAHRGTLFLDEIGELKLSLQAKLLQFIESKEFFPLGSAKPRKADVRIIAATNVDLKAAVARGEFRADLFYRLQVLPIRMPALADRPEDIPELVAHFCARACETHGSLLLRLSPGAVHAAEVADWPGNVRELENVVEAAVVRAMSERAPQIERRHMFPDATAGSSARDGEPITYREATRRFQARLVQRVLDETDWNITEAARRLDVTRQTIHTLLNEFGIEGRNI